MNTAKRARNRETMTAPLGNRVRERRLALGITQTELARRCGLVRQTVSQVERIAGYRPTAVVCLRIARALGCDVAELFYEREAP